MTIRVDSARLAALAAVCVFGGGLASAPLAATAGPWAAEPEARVRLVSGLDRAPTAGTSALDLGVEFSLAPGWHVYWKNSGDAGYAPRVDFSATPAIREVALLFPAPHRFDLPGGLVSFGYEDAVVYPLAGELVSDGRALAIRGRIDYLVCASECVPYAADLALDLPAADAAEPAGAGTEVAALARFRAALPVAAGADGAPSVLVTAISRHGHEGDTALELRATGNGFRAAAPDLFFENHAFYALGRPELAIDGDGVRFVVPYHPLDETKSRPAASDFAWTLTGLERNGRPFSVAGTTRVDSPSPVAAAGHHVWLFAVPVVAFLLWLVFRRKRPPFPQTA